MNEQALREALVDYGVQLVQSGLVQGTWGNLSVRLDEKYMLVTPSGLAYTSLTPDDIVKVELATLAYEGSVKPTSEKALHQQIYLHKPEANAVIHTHSDCCSVLAAACKPLPAITEALGALTRGDVAVAKYGLPGTNTLARNTVAAMGERNAALMAHHGAVACGDTLDRAYRCCLLMEQAAQRYIEEASCIFEARRA